MNDQSKAKLSAALREKWASGTRKPNPTGYARKAAATTKARGRNVGFLSLSSLEKRRVAKEANEHIQQGDKHPRAKWHQFRDPWGKAHVFRNLRQFVLDHPQLFQEGDAVIEVRNGRKHIRGAAGLFSLKNSMKTDKPKAATSWKGWTLIAMMETDRSLLEVSAKI